MQDMIAALILAGVFDSLDARRFFNDAENARITTFIPADGAQLRLS